MVRSGDLSAVPERVLAAERLADGRGFTKSSTPETGRLLRRLATLVRTDGAADLGTGCGVGAAWLARGLP